MLLQIYLNLLLFVFYFFSVCLSCIFSLCHIVFTFQIIPFLCITYFSFSSNVSLICVISIDNLIFTSVFYLFSFYKKIIWKDS